MVNEACWYKEVCPVECEPSCIKFIEMSYLMNHSGIPVARQRPQTLIAPRDDYDAYMHLADIRRNIVSFVEQGKNLYIAGRSTGNGKTSWAIKLMLKYFDEIWAGNGLNVRGIFVHVPTFLLKCKDFAHRDEEFEQLKSLLSSVDLVIWDDIASTDISAYDYSQLLMYLDNRVLNMKSNIYTGNFDSRDLLEQRLGIKLSSRIWSLNTDVVIFNGGDRR